MDCCATPPHAGPLLAQVLGVGLVWTTLHCAGMCGPLVAGLRLGSRGCALSAATAAGDAAAYQLGRGLTLSGLGALAGWIGHGALAVVARGSVVVGFAIALGFIAHALGRLLGSYSRKSSRQKLISASSSPGARGRSPRETSQQRGRADNAFGCDSAALHHRAVVATRPSPVARLAARVARLAPGRPRLGAFLLGLTLGLMPCMIVAWALSLAAAGADALLGAAVMACLALLTIPVLTLSAVAPAIVGRLRRRRAAWVGPSAMLFSAAWMLLIASAAAGWIAHRSVAVGAYAVMFW